MSGNVMSQSQFSWRSALGGSGQTRDGERRSGFLDSSRADRID